MLLGQVDGEFMDDFAGVSGEGAKETAVPVHDDKSESGVVFEEFVEGFGVEFIVAEVQGSVDRFEGFEINVEFALFAFVCDDVTAQKVIICWEV
jgi:hypothetical protein